MAYTDITDNSIMTLAKVKEHLSLDSDFTAKDTTLSLALEAAKEAADNYCQDNFDPVPSGIELWILQVVALWYEKKMPTINLMEYDDLGKSYFKFDYDEFYHLLKPYRREVGFR